MSKLKFETLQLHAGQETDTNTKAFAVPIYQTAAYGFDSAEHAKNLFSLKESGNIYSRIMNPTTDVLEKRMAALDGGVGALATSSGSSAITYAVLNVTQPGDEIIVSRDIYGGTYNFFSNTIKDFGITAKFFDINNPKEIENLVTEKTKAVFIETIGNPNAPIADIKTISDLSHKNDLPLIVDNTFATPYLCKPIDFGADVVVYSATKFLCGHGTTLGGIIVDGGNFNWKLNKFTNFNTPDPGYHNLVYSDLGKEAFIIRARVRLLRDTGATISPFNSFLLLQGIETLSLRMERHVQNAETIVKFLKNHPNVSNVNYPKFFGSNEEKQLIDIQLPRGIGSIFTFDVRGGLEGAKAVVDSVKIFTHLANVADAKSLIIQPASTTHSQVPLEELKNLSLKPETIRLSVGIENVDDLIGDLEQALGKIKV